MERKYTAFISYRHAPLDSEVARQLHTRIEQYTIPRGLRKNGVKKLGLVFRDQEELPISSNLSDDICKALDNSQYLIVVCSENTAQSPWVSREIDYFLSHHDQQHTLVALASGEPVDVFPRALTVRPDGKGGMEEVEPLAIDVRAYTQQEMKKRIKREIFRLYAALIGCPYDALVMRHQRRKRRQLAAIMGVILAVVTGFSAMMLVKNHQIDQKNEELAGMNQTLEDKNRELEDKNDELARQKAEVQLRESELLTEKGSASVAQGDSQAALELFLSALPNGEDSRPYYAPAEQGLIATLGIHDTKPQQYRVFERVLEQKNPVTAFEISPDGTRIMAFDEYSLATCFDTATGEVLWTRQITEGSFSASMPAPDLGGVIVNAAYGIFFVEWQQGEILWSMEDALYADLSLLEDQSVLAARGHTFVDNMANYQHWYIFLDTKTGKVLQRVELGKSYVGLGTSEEEEELPAWWFGDLIDEESLSGTFSRDGSKFLFFYQEEVYDESRIFKFLEIDRLTGTVRPVYEFEVDTDDSMTDPLRALYSTDGTALLVIRNSRKTGIPFQLDRVDLATGEVLWTNTVEHETTEDLRNATLRVLQYEKHLLVCRNGYMYLVSTEDGEADVSCSVMGSRILTLEQTAEQELGLVFEDGRYSPGWINGSNYVTMADTHFEFTLPMEAVYEAKLYNGGMAGLVIKDSTVENAQVNTQGLEDGYVAVRPRENDCTVAIKWAVYFGDVLERTQIPLLEENEYLLFPTATAAGKDGVIVGPKSRELPDGSMEYTFYRINTKTLAVEEDIVTPWKYLSGEIFFPDAGGYLWITDSTGITWQDGSDDPATDLIQAQKVPYPDGSEQEGDSHIFRGAKQAADGKILTAALGEGVLTYWLDGREKTEVSLPEDLQEEWVKGKNWYRFLMAGSNGTLAVLDMAQSENWQSERLGVYDIHARQWYFVDTPWDIADGAVASANTQPWVLIRDSENKVHICDYTTGKTVWEFSLQMPAGAVKRAFFTEDDRYIAVQTADNHAFLYDPATAEVLFTHALTGTATKPLQILLDEARNRMYLWCNSERGDTGYCLDMDSWTVLAEIPGLLWYDADNNAVYRIARGTDSYKDVVQVYSFPDMEELVRAGRKIMGN